MTRQTAKTVQFPAVSGSPQNLGDDDYLKTMTKSDRSDGVHPSPIILALGDSLTSGHGLAGAESFAAQLELRLRAERPGAQVINAGVSGDTTSDALRRLPKVLGALVRRPDLAIVELGANDLLRRIPPAQVRSNLAMIVEELQRCAIPVLLATLEQPPFLRAYVGDYSDIYANIARAYAIPTCPFFPRGVLGNPRMVLADKVHPNAPAVALCAENMLPHVLHALDRESRRAA